MNSKKNRPNVSAVMFSAILVILAAAALVSCDNELEVQQSYPFVVETMPVPARIVKGETVEIRFPTHAIPSATSRRTARGRSSWMTGWCCCPTTAIRLTGRCSGCITLPHAKNGSR